MTNRIDTTLAAIVWAAATPRLELAHLNGMLVGSIERKNRFSFLSELWTVRMIDHAGMGVEIGLATAMGNMDAKSYARRTLAAAIVKAVDETPATATAMAAKAIREGEDPVLAVAAAANKHKASYALVREALSLQEKR